MRATPPLAWLAYGVAGAVIGADQLVKRWIVHGLGLALGRSMVLIGPVHLTLVENRGVSFGLFQSDAPWTRWALAAFSGVVAVALAVWARRAEKPLAAVAIGLIVGGATGNLIDRVRFGAVTDFIDVQRLFFPWVFNVADSAITIGIVLLLAESLLAPKTAPR
ncbi:MAG: signal peptidase II [Caulobacteraceae bacterium]